MADINKILKTAEVFEKLAKYGDRKSFLEALAQDSGLDPFGVPTTVVDPNDPTPQTFPPPPVQTVHKMQDKPKDFTQQAPKQLQHWQVLQQANAALQKAITNKTAKANGTEYQSVQNLVKQLSPLATAEKGDVNLMTQIAEAKKLMKQVDDSFGFWA